MTLPTFVTLLITTALLFSSCGDSRDESLAKIADLESRFAKDSVTDSKAKLAYNLEIAYTDFASRFAEDSLAPEYLFKAGEQNFSQKWYERAVKSFDLYLTKYPEHSRVPEALFYEAFIYENHLHNNAKAGELYGRLVEKYPGHFFAQSAADAIRILGKSGEEVVKEFEQREADSAAVRSAK